MIYIFLWCVSAYYIIQPTVYYTLLYSDNERRLQSPDKHSSDPTLTSTTVRHRSKPASMLETSFLFCVARVLDPDTYQDPMFVRLCAFPGILPAVQQRSKPACMLETVIFFVGWNIINLIIIIETVMFSCGLDIRTPCGRCRGS